MQLEDSELEYRASDAMLYSQKLTQRIGIVFTVATLMNRNDLDFSYFLVSILLG